MDNDNTLSRDELRTEYHRGIAVKLALIAVSVLGIVLFVGLMSISNYEGIGLRETYEIIWNHLFGNGYETGTLQWWADRYIWNTAMPHALAAIIAGAALAVCGTMMQATMSNPLADPYSTGISSGACFGAISAIVMGVSFSTVAGEMGIVVNAFIGALVPALLIIILSQRIQMTPATLILLGTAVSYFFNSMVTYVMVTTDADTLQSRHLLTEDRSVRFAVKPAVLHLFCMVGLDIFKCFTYDSDQFRVYIVVRFFDFCFCYKNIIGIDLCAVEFFCIFKESLISLLFYCIEDLTHAVLIFSITVRAALYKGLEQIFFRIFIQFFDSHINLLRTGPCPG